MATRIQLRRDTAANWTATNPILASAEIGIETDTEKLKIGDGATEWNSLLYLEENIDIKDLADITSLRSTWSGKQDALTFGIADTNKVKIDSSTVTSGEFAKFTANGLESRSTSEVLSDISAQAALTFGIADTNKVQINAADVADDDYAKFTATGLEGRSYSEVLSDIGAEAASNKENTTLDTSTSKYPTNRLVKEYADSLVAGLLDYRGAYNASGNTYPASGGSGTAGAIMKGDMWIISVAGTLNSIAIHVGDYVIALIDTPAQTAANWDTLDTNLGYIPEDVANRRTTFQVTPDDTHYTTEKLVKDQLDLKVDKVASSSLVADSEISKIHTAGTDQGLDTGGANAVTAVQAKAGYTHSGVAHAPSDAVSLATVKADGDYVKLQHRQKMMVVNNFLNN